MTKESKEPVGFKGLDRSVRMQKIIDAATRLFHQKGYRTATLDDLAGELGISKAALYRYVSSKENLLSMVYNQAFDKIFRRIFEISAMDISPREKLRLIIQDHIKNIIIKNLAMFSVFFAEENQLPQGDFQKIREERRKYTRAVEKIIREGIAEGTFREVDPKLQSYAIIGMCNWIYKWYKPDREDYSPDAIADHFTALLETGYLAGTAGSAGEPAMRGEYPKTGNAAAMGQIREELKTMCGRLTLLVDMLDRE